MKATLTIHGVTESIRGGKVMTTLNRNIYEVPRQSVIVFLQAQFLCLSLALAHFMHPSVALSCCDPPRPFLYLLWDVGDLWGLKLLVGDDHGELWYGRFSRIVVVQRGEIPARISM